MSDLLILGNACVDIYVPAHEPPPPGGISVVPAIELQVGGNAANTAIAAARLRCATSIAGILGDDVFGRIVQETFKTEGVDARWLHLIAGKNSPATVVQNDASGERSFVHHPGTNVEFRLPEGALDVSCSIFHMAAPELLPGIWHRGAIDIARRLKGCGRTVTLDTFVDVSKSALDIIEEHRELLGLVDLVFPNEEEAQLISGREELRSVVNYFHDCGVQVVVIKRGARGAVVSWEGHFEIVEASAVRAVDTCGAGDNFVAGFLAGHVRGFDPLLCTRIGCAMGTLCVQYQGALTGGADPDRLRELAGLGPLW